MSIRQLQVLANNAQVGTLRDENDLWQFTHAEGWRESARGFDLSPGLSRQTQHHADGATSRPVQWYFDNLLPEEALRTTIAKDAKLSAEDSFGLLAWFGAESAGSLILHDPGARRGWRQGTVATGPRATHGDARTRQHAGGNAARGRQAYRRHRGRPGRHACALPRA